MPADKTETKAAQFTLGYTGENATTYNASTIYRDGEGVLMVYGLPQNTTLKELEADTPNWSIEPLAFAKSVVNSLNEYPRLKQERDELAEQYHAAMECLRKAEAVTCPEQQENSYFFDMLNEWREDSLEPVLLRKGAAGLEQELAEALRNLVHAVAQEVDANNSIGGYLSARLADAFTALAKLETERSEG